MEDILASIRRILNEEEPKPATDVLELTPAMRADAPLPPPEATSPPPEPEPAPPAPVAMPVVIAAPAPAPVIASLPPELPHLMASAQMESSSPHVEPEPEPPSLVAPAAAAAAAASVGELVRRLASTQHVAVTRGGPTIEDLVREEIRGLLKAWLDENLPHVVERLVRAEIERVVGRHVG
jgi:cell pole-organizing protein PopZ